jgi:site-specific DNA recombinase
MNTKRGQQARKSVGIWIRVSTEQQVEGESPERHEERARGYAAAKGWEVAEVYRLDAVSGKSVMGHPTARRMLADLRKGRIGALVFSKLARLARNTRELLEIADEFEKFGADLVSLEECIDTSSPAGRVFFTMIAAMAQWEREEISSRLAASVPVRARMGRSTGGKPVYGFHWADGRLVPHPDEAPVRRLMYELYLEHRRKLTVARVLNERGFRTRGGGEWTGSSVGRLLADPAAKGQRLANFTKRTASGSREPKPEDEWVTVPVEPIVPAELWEECNRILREGRDAHAATGRKGRKPKHLFSGLVFCGSCGNGVKMYPQTGTAKYRCFKCANKIPKDDLEALFIEQLSGFVLDDARIADYLAQAGEAVTEKRSLAEGLSREREQGRRRLEALVDLYQDGSVGREEFRRQSAPLEERGAQIDATLAELAEEIGALESGQATSEEIGRDGAKLVGQWFELSHARRRELAENLLSKITVDRSEVDFEMKYLPGQAGNLSPHVGLCGLLLGEPSEELAVAVGAGDGGIDEALPLAVEFFRDEDADLLHGAVVEGGVADDAALSDIFPLQLELGLDEADDGAALLQHAEGGGEDLGKGDEREVHDDEADLLAEGGDFQAAGVELLLHDDAGVSAELVDELVGADIDGVDLGRAVLEQAVREAAGGGADIEAGPALRRDAEGGEGALHLQAAATDVFRFLLDLQWGILRKLGARLVHEPVAGADLAGQDQALGLLAGLAESAGDEEGIGSLFLHPAGSKAPPAPPGQGRNGLNPSLLATCYSLLLPLSPRA